VYLKNATAAKKIP